MDGNTKFIVINASILTGILAFMLFPDVLFGLLIQLMHLLMEFTHILFEFIESTLDHLIEHIFNTDLHQTQVIVFYLIVFMILAGCYGLWCTVPRVFGRAKHGLIDFWDWEKTTIFVYWRGLTVIQKTSLSLSMATILYVIFILSF